MCFQEDRVYSVSQPISCEVRLLSLANEGLAPQTGRPDVEETWFLAGGKPSGLSHIDKDTSIRVVVWTLFMNSGMEMLSSADSHCDQISCDAALH